MPQIIHERPEDAALIEPLLDECFGPERFTKTAYKIRENIHPLPELSFVIRDGDKLVATIRYWPITIGDMSPALLLGPIAVEPTLQGRGLGIALIRQSLQMAIELGHKIIVLVGDPEYYGQFGFDAASPKGLQLPGPVEDRRFLVKECEQGALRNVSGVIAGGSMPDISAGRVAKLSETEQLIAKLAAFAPPA